MKYEVSGMIPMGLSDEGKKNFFAYQRSMMFCGLEKKLERDRWYAFRWHEEVNEAFSFSVDGEQQAHIVSVDIEPTQERYMTIHCIEDDYLNAENDKDIWTKLKSCWKYLRDNRDDYMEEKTRK